MIRRTPRPAAPCRNPYCNRMTRERDEIGRILAAIVAVVGGRIEVPADKVDVLDGTTMTIERTGDVWTITTSRAFGASKGATP